MKTKLLTLSIVAILAAGCSQSDDETASKESLTEKAATAVSSMKDATKAAADVAMDKGKEITEAVTEKAGSAAEEASNFVKKGSSKVVTVVEDAKEGISSTVDSVKEKAGEMLSGSSTDDATAAAKDKVDALTSDTGSSSTESMKESATSALSESSTVKAISENSTVAAVMGTSAAAEKTGDTADLAAGKATYTAKCVACHGSGATGAPKLDDSSWAERKAQGMDVMVEHAVKGFRGAKGYMPAKGGFAALTDTEVKAAVAYMVSAAK